MTNHSKQRGTAWESAIVAYLIEQGWPYAERRALAGGADKGDIAGVAGVMIEAKNEKAITLGTYIAEVETQTVNAGARVGLAVIKRRGKGSPGDAYAVMTLATATRLLKEAGY